MKELVDQALKLSREIMKLEQQERHLREKREQKRAELARLLSGGELPAQKQEYRPGSLTSKIIGLLQARYPEALSAEAIASALQTDPATVRSPLSRLKAQHHVESPSRGEYRAVLHEETKGGET